MAYTPQFYPGTTSVAENRRRFMSNKVNKVRDVSDEDLTAMLGHRAPGSDYPSTHPPLAEMGEPDCPIREIVRPTPGTAAGDRVRYVQWADSMYNSPGTPYWRSYHAAINHRGIDPGTLSGRQVVEARERDMEAIAKEQIETDMTCVGLAGLRGCTVHGHSCRLQEDGTMFDMLDRRRLEGDTIVQDKDQVGVPIDRKVNLGKPMIPEEAAKKTTFYRVGNVAYRHDPEAIEWLQKIWELRTIYGYQPIEMGWKESIPDQIIETIQIPIGQTEEGLKYSTVNVNTSKSKLSTLITELVSYESARIEFNANPGPIFRKIGINIDDDMIKEFENSPITTMIEDSWPQVGVAAVAIVIVGVIVGVIAPPPPVYESPKNINDLKELLTQNQPMSIINILKDP